jgi:hypothetical protein
MAMADKRIPSAVEGVSHPGLLPLSELQGVTEAKHARWPLLSIGAHLFRSVLTQLYVRLPASAAAIEEASE